MEGHLRMLCEEIGARPTGSEANRAAVEYACGEFERFGLSVSKQEFDCMDWREDGGTLTVEGQDIPIAPAPYSLNCDLQGRIDPYPFSGRTSDGGNQRENRLAVRCLGFGAAYAKEFCVLEPGRA